jgi:hypothetical protein
LGKFPNVWASGHSGLYLAHATLSGAVPGDHFVKTVTDNAYASDCLLSKDTSARHFRNENKNDSGNFRYKIYCVVGNDNAEDFMGEALKVAKLEPDIPLDVTFSPIATGNEKYINWGRLNSVKPDPEANLFKK